MSEILFLTVHLPSFNKIVLLCFNVLYIAIIRMGLLYYCHNDILIWVQFGGGVSFGLA